MSWLHRIPMRYLLPLLLGTFAVVIIALAYLNTRPDVISNVERAATSRMRATLTQTQGAIELLWRTDNFDGVKSLLASFGSERGQTATVVVGRDGDILAATSLRDVGKSAATLYPNLDSTQIERINTTGGTSVRISPDRKSISGYARICGPDPTNLRTRECGFLYHEKSLIAEMSVAVGSLRNQTVKSALAMCAVTLLFIVLLYFLVSQRAQRLVASARAFASGDLDVRTNMEGSDELAEVGQAIDSMLDTVVEDQVILRLREKVIADSTNGITIVDATLPDQPIIDCNPGFEKITGYSRNEILGRNCRFLQSHDREQPEIKMICDAVQAGRSCQATLRNYRKDGEMFWNELSISPIVTESGEIKHFIGIQNDITIRRRAEQVLKENHDLLERRVLERTAELRESEERYRELFENAGDLIQSVAPNGSFLYVNPAWCDTLGYTDKEVASLSLFDVIDPDDLARCTTVFDRVTKSEAVHDIEVKFRTKTGDIVLLEGSASCHFEYGVPIETRAILHDITRHVAAEESLQQARDIAESATAAKSRFLAAASHDLRQPLQSVGLYVSVLDRLLDQPKPREISTKIRTSLDVMGNLLDALLDVSKFDSGSISPAKKDFRIQTVLDELIASNEPSAREKGLVLRCIGSTWVVHSDPSLLGRIIENFVTNAIRYTESGEIEIRCQSHDEFVRIEVADTGIGIPESSRETIFEEYYQLDNDVRDRRKGLGLGLSIAKQIAQLLDHRLDVSSEVGKGSIFSVEVPLGKPIARESGGQFIAAIEQPSGREPIVLLVDDDLAIVDATTMLLESAGALVYSALDCDEALAHLDDGVRPDIVISDYRLPGLTGVEVIRRVRAATVDKLPAILMTGDTAINEFEKSEIAHCTILRKPADTDQLISAVMDTAI